MKNQKKAKDYQKYNILRIKINSFLINYFNYLILALSLIIFLVGLFFFVYPQYRQINQSSQATFRNLQKNYDEKYDYLNSIRKQKRSYQQITEEDKSKIKTMVPATSDVSNIISEVESIITKNSAVLNSIKLAPDNSKNQSATNKAQSADKKEQPAGIFEQTIQGVGRVKIDIQISSVNYPVLKNIIKTLENNLRLMDISKINYSVQDNKAILEIYTYYLYL